MDVDIVANLHLVPKFNEHDPDTFFTLLGVLQMQKMGQIDRVLMLKCILTGRAQEALYSAVCGKDGLDYEAVKAAGLKAYTLVPEAYCLKFRNWVTGDKQM